MGSVGWVFRGAARVQWGLVKKPPNFRLQLFKIMKTFGYLFYEYRHMTRDETFTLLFISHGRQVVGASHGGNRPV